MATYCNPHWLLSHIRNSFISTDDTGMCETVMVSDDMPKNYLRKYQGNGTRNMQQQQQQRRSMGSNQLCRNLDPPLQEVDFVCYPGLDQSDDEDIDLTTQSFDIQMYPEVGAHRFRSNTAQKLEKMDIARRKAAFTKCVNYDEDVVPPERSDFFVRKQINGEKFTNPYKEDSEIKSRLTLQLANSPKQVQNKFQEYAKFDGTSQSGVQTKRINIFLNMLTQKERNYPIKICVLASAKIHEVIGFVCYKATSQYPDLPLKSVRHYGLYMTEDNDDLEDFPPLDNREPCAKFGFSHLTLAERRSQISSTRPDHDQISVPTKSMTSEEEKSRLAAMAVHSLTCTGVGADGFVNPDDRYDDIDSGKNPTSEEEQRMDEFEQRIINQDDVLEAPIYRTYNLNIIDKLFFKTGVTLGISGDHIEIDQHKQGKFWNKQRAITYPIDSVAYCEIVERRTMRAVVRIWLRTSSSLLASNLNESKNSANTNIAQSPTSPSHHTHFSTSFSFLNISSSNPTSHSQSTYNPPQMRFKHYDFEASIPLAEQIYKKLNCILEMRSSEVRREFLQLRARKLEKSQAKRHLKL
uniref:Uncharacterized protein n=1 Tax=Glossina brevipalpis TaxID=37001 RepID=A0A1A9WMX0_9MUSC